MASCVKMNFGVSTGARRAVGCVRVAGWCENIKGICKRNEKKMKIKLDKRGEV